MDSKESIACMKDIRQKPLSSISLLWRERLKHLKPPEVKNREPIKELRLSRDGI
jgi:hypothetical protein